MAQTSEYLIGTVVRFLTTGAFTSISGVAVDPDEVGFAYEVQGQNPVQFTYTNGTGDTTGTIVRDGTGLYHADIDTTTVTPGTLVYVWWCKATVLDADVTRTQTRAEGSIVLTPQTVAAP